MRTAFQDEAEEQALAARQEASDLQALEARQAHEVNEDDETDPHPHGSADRELTLSSTTLLMIFFALVLICALFFGLGYSLGRRSPSDAVAAESHPAAASTQLADSQSKPSAAAQPVSSSASTPAPPEPQSDSEASASEPEPQPRPAKAEANKTEAAQPTPAVRSVNLPTPEAAPQTVVTTPAPETATLGIMVQIAAISNPADADVLVRALEKHGYTVVVRRSASDTLMHVQVGPFANRTDAIAIRQKLLSDGYNAILK